LKEEIDKAKIIAIRTETRLPAQLSKKDLVLIFLIFISMGQSTDKVIEEKIAQVRMLKIVCLSVMFSGPNDRVIFVTLSIL
jgi:hypothetical protein